MPLGFGATSLHLLKEREFFFLFRVDGASWHLLVPNGFKQDSVPKADSESLYVSSQVNTCMQPPRRSPQVTHHRALHSKKAAALLLAFSKTPSGTRYF